MMNEFHEIRTQDDLTNLVMDIGFLPFFQSEIAGFSVDELTPLEVWEEYLGLGPWLYDLVVEFGPISAPELKRKLKVDSKHASWFDSGMTRLQMMTYIVPVDFIFPRDASGRKKYSYGTTVFGIPERWLGEELCYREYDNKPDKSFEIMVEHLMKKLKTTDRKSIERLLK